MTWEVIEEGRYGRLYLKAPTGQEYVIGDVGDFKQLAIDLNAHNAPPAALVEALRRAHDRMDNVNASTSKAQCVWCRSEGYDGDGLMHASDCIILELRAALNSAGTGEAT